MGLYSWHSLHVPCLSFRQHKTTSETHEHSIRRIIPTEYTKHVHNRLRSPEHNTGSFVSRAITRKARGRDAMHHSQRRHCESASKGVHRNWIQLHWLHDGIGTSIIQLCRNDWHVISLDSTTAIHDPHLLPPAFQTRLGNMFTSLVAADPSSAVIIFSRVMTQTRPPHTHAHTSALLVRVGLEVVHHIHCPRVFDTFCVVSDEPVVADGEIGHLIGRRKALLTRLVAVGKVRVHVGADGDLHPALLHLCNTVDIPVRENAPIPTRLWHVDQLSNI